MAPALRRLTPKGTADPHPTASRPPSPSGRRNRYFRDRLRAEPATAEAYAQEKARCAALHPDDSAAYTACKQAWTDAVAAEAVGLKAKIFPLAILQNGPGTSTCTDR